MSVSVLTRGQAFRARQDDALLTWVEFYGRDVNGDPQTYFWSDSPASTATAKLEPRVLRFGTDEAALSGPDGQLEASLFSFELADTDHLLRGFLGTDAQRVLQTLDVVVKVQPIGDFIDGVDPIVVFRGRVKNYRPLAGNRFQFDCHNALAEQIGKPMALPIARSAFAGVPTANMDRRGGRWYGRHSNEASADDPPEFDDNPARGFIEDGSWIAGYGDRGGPAAPTGLALSEDLGAGNLANAQTVRVAVSMIKDGIEGEISEFLPADAESITTTAANSAIDASCDDAGAAADTYRFYVGGEYFGVRFIFYIDSATPAVSITKCPVLPASGDITPGGVAVSTFGMFDYAVTSVRSDGETALSEIARGVSSPMPDGRPLYIQWTAVGGDLGYYVYRRAVGGNWSLRQEIAVGVTEFTDSLDVDDWEPVNGPPTGSGIVPCFYVGQLVDQFGIPMYVFAIAGHAITELISAYFIDEDDVATRVDDAQWGVDWFGPGKGWGDRFGGTEYYDAPDDSRWALIATISGGTAEALATGTLQLRANVIGVEDVGDGSGDAILSRYQQVRHLLEQNGVCDTPYAGGNWLAAPLWADSSPRIDADSFDAVEAWADWWFSSIDGAWGVTEPDRVVDIVAALMVSLDTAYGPTRAGALRLVLEAPIDIVPVDALTGQRDVDELTPEWDELVESLPDFHNVEPYAFEPVYPAEGGAPTFNGTDEARSDDAGGYPDIEYPLRPTRTELVAHRSPVTSAEVMSRRVWRAERPPRVLRPRTGRQAIHYELGDILLVDNDEGPGADGFVEQPVMVRRRRTAFDLGVVDLELRSLDYSDEILEELMSVRSLGGHETNGYGNQANGTYLWPDARPVVIDWSTVPQAWTVQARVFTKHESGGSQTPKIYNVGAALTDTTLVNTGVSKSGTGWEVQLVDIPRESGVCYYMAKSTIAGAAALEVWAMGDVEFTR